MTRYAFRCENLQLSRLTNNGIDKVERPDDTWPKTLSQLNLGGIAELGGRPLAGTRLDLFWCARSRGSPAATGLCNHLVGASADVAYGAKANLNLNMPADHGAIRLRRESDSIHL